MRAHRFLLLLLAVALLAAGGLHVGNVFEARRPSADRFILERKLARAITEGKNVLPPPGINESALRWHTASLMEQAPAVAVFGSSHGLLITAELLGGAPLMNFSISGATLPDHLITTSLLRERQLYPRRWLILVDSWLCDRDTDFGNWRPRADRLAKIETELAQAGTPTLTPVFSPRYHAPTAASWAVPYSLDPLTTRVDELLREWFDSVHVVAEVKNSPHYLLRTDGSYYVPPELMRENQAQAREQALRQFATNADRHRYGNFERIDPELWQFFTRWLALCRTGGAEVWLLFPPYHPAIYPKIIAHPRNQLRRVEARVRELARQQGYRVFGSYAPAAAGVGEAHFSDGDHLTPAGLERLLAPVAAALAQETRTP